MDNILKQDLQDFSNGVLKNANLTSSNLHKINAVMFNLEHDYSINPMQLTYLQDALKEFNQNMSDLLDDAWAMDSLVEELENE